MGKHTAGPWVVWEGRSEVFANCDGENTGFSIIGTQVCRCDPDDLYPDGIEGVDEDEWEEYAEAEAEANAHLIAAAPELLEAAHEIYSGVVSHSHDGERVSLNVSRRAFKMLETAIAKAEPPK